jgi:hypothetical protein
MNRRDAVVRTLVLGALVGAAGCASGSGLPRLVPGSNITLPRTELGVVRELLMGCEASADSIGGPGRPTGGCGSVIGGTRSVPSNPGTRPGQQIP